MALKSNECAAVMMETVPDDSVGGVWAGQKIGNNIFKPNRYNICTLNSEMKAKWHCCCVEMGAETQDNAVTSNLWSVHKKGMTFTKMAKLPDGYMCSQQFTVKHGVMTPHVSQFSGDGTVAVAKWGQKRKTMRSRAICGLSTRKA
jgi:hypothetical protein